MYLALEKCLDTPDIRTLTPEEFNPSNIIQVFYFFFLFLKTMNNSHFISFFLLYK